MLQQVGRYSRQAGGQILTVLAICVSLALPVVEARDEPAPVIEAASVPGVSRTEAQEIVERISHLERQLDNQALVDMLTNMDRLRQEIQQLLSRMEEQAHSLDELQKRQRDLYLDIDQRLGLIEKTQAEAAAVATTPAPAPSAPATAAGSPSALTPARIPTPTSATRPAPENASVTPSLSATASGESAVLAPASTLPAIVLQQVNPQLERKHYEKAFNLLKDGHYDQAVAAFQAFLETFPVGRFADNVQYWLGEASYVQGRYSDALMEFEKVINNYPASPKRADAMLKMAYTHQKLGDQEQATVLLNQVIENFPDATAANLAKKRLQNFKRIQ